MLLLTLGLVFLAVEGPWVGGQQPAGPGQFAQLQLFNRMQKRREVAQPVDGVFLPVDRETALKLARAKEMLEKGQVADAVIELDRILDRREDFFFKPDAKETVHRSLKAEAQRLLGSLDKDQRGIYELQFGAQARRLLDDATSSGSLEQLAEVVRRYFHTTAGYEAALVLARRHSDHNQPLAAALVLERIKKAPAAREQYEPNLSLMLAASWLRAGLRDKAQAELASIKSTYPGARLELAGKRFDTGDDAASLAALATIVASAETGRRAAVSQWAMPGGNPARNATVSGGSPLLNERWSAGVFYSASLKSEIGKVRKQFIDTGRPVIPSAQPLAVGNVVLMRTPNVVYGVDFATGKLLWPWPPQPSIEEQANPGRDAAYMQMISERMWANNTYGTMTTDGERMFLVHEGDIQEALRGAMQTRSQPAMIMANGQVIQGMTHNVMSAHSLRREGAIAWYVGGLESEMEPELAGAFFLGPPLPLQGQLYALAEIKGGISLVVLDAETGKLEWIQQLAMVEQNVHQDPLRRVSGVSPSFADGVLVCPTSAGAVVAVDLATRSLLWGYQYPRTAEQERLVGQRVAMGMNFNGTIAVPVNPGSHWVDNNAVIADGRVYVMAVESDQLHCLSLLDGKELWPPKKRDGGLYVAAVGGERLLVIREQQVDVLNGSDGKIVRTTPLGSSRPSGRGFYSGEHYYLPLSSAEVVKIDPTNGEIQARARSRSGAIPGNLICYQGYVISQGIDSLNKYFQIEPLRKQVAEMVAANPNDPEALVWRGELALADGNLKQAVADLRTSFQFKPAADANREYLERLEAERLRTQGLLIDALTALLHVDFSGNRSSLSELEALIETDQDRAQYLRVLAAGLHREGKIDAALEAYLKLADLKTGASELEDVEADRSVRRERWIGARLEELWKSTSPENRATIDEAIATRLSAATTASDSKEEGARADRLRQFIDVFAFHPLSDSAREELLGELAEAESPLEREQLLAQLEKSTDRTRAGAAVTRLASLYQSAARNREAARYYRKLARDFADVPCLGGKTGKEIVAALPANDEVRRAMDQRNEWPAGKVEHPASRSRTASRNQGYQQYWNVELRGQLGSFFAGRSVQFDQSMIQLVGRDELGQETFRLLLNEAAQFRNYFYGYNTNYAVVDGHLLLINTGFQVLAINTLRQDNRAKAVVWREDLIDPVQLQMQQMRGFGGFQNAPRNNPWGPMRNKPAGFGNQPAAGMSQVIDGGVAIQRGRELSFVDALTGKPLWVRQNIPIESDVYGDGEILIVAPGDSSTPGRSSDARSSAVAAGTGDVEALILRTRDGELLGKRKVPVAARRWTTYGRKVLTWNDRGRSMQLVLKDVWAGKEIELGAYPDRSKGTIVGGDSVAIYDATGKFVVHSLDDGRKLMEAQVEPDDSLHNIVVQRSDSQYILMSNRPRLARGSAGQQNYQPAMPDPSQTDGFNSGLISGRVYAFDRKSGESQWSKPALIDMQGYFAAQGAELPALVFVRHIQQRNQMKVSILCLDKRTGRAVFQNEDINGQAHSFEAMADLDERTVTLQIPGQEFVLKFTDQPVKPEPPYQAVVEPAAKSAGSPSTIGQIFRILGQAADEAARKKMEKEAEQKPVQDIPPPQIDQPR
ncbi:MAG: PQQ-binding-like beta-propeller repeat protein [Pirellulales bacterium]